MFTVEQRDEVRDRLLAKASSDERVVAAAVIGSLAHGGGDQWADLDLTFAVADEVPLSELLEDWTRDLADELDAVVLFDLEAGGAIYRVLLLPNNLQIDLSFSRASEFRARSPRFELVFGTTQEAAHAPPPRAEDLFGWAVVYALHARSLIERERLWRAAHAIGSLREYALNLACLRRGLPGVQGRGFDDLPADVLDAFRPTLVRSLEPDDLREALAAGVAGLLRESADLDDVAMKVRPQLRDLFELPAD